MTVSHGKSNIDWERVIRETITRSTESAPDEPGVYRMPCGNCYVDFFLAPDGRERWLVPGDDHNYTRDTVAIARHGDHPWERMYTLADAAVEIRRRATVDGTPVRMLIKELAAIAVAEGPAENEQIEGIDRNRTGDSEEIVLADLARKFGVDLDEP